MFVTELLGSFRTSMGGYLWNKAIEYIGVYISPNLRENPQVGLNVIAISGAVSYTRRDPICPAYLLYELSLYIHEAATVCKPKTEFASFFHVSSRRE